MIKANALYVLTISVWPYQKISGIEINTKMHEHDIKSDSNTGAGYVKCALRTLAQIEYQSYSS